MPTTLENSVSWLVKEVEYPWPTLLDGDPAGLRVLNELAIDTSPYVRARASEGLDRIESGAKGQVVYRSRKIREIKPNDVRK